MEHDVFVSGGGIAGLVAAAAFGANGFSVLCVDPKPLPTEDDDTKDLRTTAILRPGRALMESVGLWAAFADHTAPLAVMRIVDQGGQRRRDKAFEAADIGHDCFGWNVQNWRLREQLVAHLHASPNVDLRLGIGTQNVTARGSQALVTLSDGSKISTRLVIGADGRASPLRHSAGIAVRTHRYGQKALAFAVSHEAPHDNISTEIHETGGPFTLVPLPDRAGQPCSAVVWMDDGPQQLARREMPEATFNSLITERSGAVLGPLTLASQRAVWPIISQAAQRLVAPRLALIAEAAHVVPPIGAQGLNMSLKDTAILLELAKASPETLGNPEMLLAYERKRLPDIKLRVTGIDLLNRASQAAPPFLRETRAMALDALHGLTPLRKSLMELGLGAKRA